MRRPRVDGKHFALDGSRFAFHGVTYGTFEPRADGARFPELNQVKQDFYAMREAGFTVVRTYTSPPEDVLKVADELGLRILADVFYVDWRYLLGRSSRQSRQLERRARDEVRATAQRLAGCDAVFGLSLGNEVPADVVRWFGAKTIARVIADLADVVREEDPEMLVTYANYPTAEYLPLTNLDFLTFNVFLEHQPDFRRYLTRLQNVAGDRALVLGEMGLDAGTGRGGEERQADTMDWMLETTLERGLAGTCLFAWTDEWWVGDRPVEGWHFGLTRADRSPRPALAVAERWNGRTVADLYGQWPSVSVVICAYNAGETLDECLRHTCALEYPHLEVIVVDDGSTDDTAAIAHRHPRCRVVPIEHAGLGTARNNGWQAASGDIVAYLDSDAYPSPEWPFYLVLGFDGETVGGVGGPNVPPPDDPPGAQMVARSPGGPVHVLLSDDRAEHVPGCNMAFWRKVLDEVAGCDPVYTSAGDDVDLCWRVLHRGWDIGFHPAALVWHHRRAGLRSYLRQQVGYGRAEALVAARHPDRFTPIGSARWRGRIYNSLLPPRRLQRVYRGPYGAAAYQSVYEGGGYLLDVVHQVGMPLAAVSLVTAALAPFSAVLAAPAVVGLCFAVVLGAFDMAFVSPSVGRWRSWSFRLGVACCHLLQPLARAWGRRRQEPAARRDLPPPESLLPGPPRRVGRRVALYPCQGPRQEVSAAIVDRLRRRGLRVALASGWEDHDARWVASMLLDGQLLTSGHPEGCVQAWVRRRVRWKPLLAGLVLLAATAGKPAGTALVSAAAVAETVRGMWNTRSTAALLGRPASDASTPPQPPPDGDRDGRGAGTDP